MRIRPNHVYALVDGAGYQAVVLRDGIVNLLMESTHPPALFTSTSTPGLWSRRVAPTELSALEHVSTHAMWRDHEIEILSAPVDGNVFVCYYPPHGARDALWAEGILKLVEPGWWDGTVPMDQLSQLHERIKDRLASALDRYHEHHPVDGE